MALRLLLALRYWPKVLGLRALWLCHATTQNREILPPQTDVYACNNMPNKTEFVFGIAVGGRRAHSEMNRGGLPFDCSGTSYPMLPGRIHLVAYLIKKISLMLSARTVFGMYSAHYDNFFFR